MLSLMEICQFVIKGGDTIMIILFSNVAEFLFSKYFISILKYVVPYLLIVRNFGKNNKLLFCV
jgi:hypothetical protein